MWRQGESNTNFLGEILNSPVLDCDLTEVQLRKGQRTDLPYVDSQWLQWYLLSWSHKSFERRLRSHTTWGLQEPESLLHLKLNRGTPVHLLSLWCWILFQQQRQFRSLAFLLFGGESTFGWTLGLKWRRGTCVDMHSLRLLHTLAAAFFDSQSISVH